MSKKFLILSYPRSATNYTAYVLWRVGLFTAHEMDQDYLKRKFGTRKELDGVVTGLFIGVKPKFGRYSPILHQVRHPLNVISSCAQKKISMISLKNLYEVFGNVPYSGSRSEFIVDIMRTWLMFTDRADELACFIYRVERMRKSWKRIKSLLGIKANVSFPREINVTVNAFRHRKSNFTWKQLSKMEPELTEKIREKAKKYGYK